MILWAITMFKVITNLKREEAGEERVRERPKAPRPTPSVSVRIMSGKDVDPSERFSFPVHVVFRTKRFMSRSRRK